MTCIAWDGRELVADRQCTIGGTPIPFRKVYRVRAPNRRVALVGYCGTAAFVRAHLHWLAGGERPEFRHERFRWSVLMIDDERRVWRRDEDADFWEEMLVRYWALGSGAEYALGVMAAGHSAREAIRIASKLDNQTGLGMNVVRFE